MTDSRHFGDDEAVIRHEAVATSATASLSRRRRSGFTLIELLTVLAIIAVLATLMLSGVARAKKRSRQTVCLGNLHQVAIAVELYNDETGRRARSLTHLYETRHLILPRLVLCAEDPAFSAVAAGSRGPGVAWGNLANGSQEPLSVEIAGDIEAPTIQQELAEITEKIPFSYLHPLGWRKSAWQRLAARGGQAGIAVCQLHGIRLASLDQRLALANGRPCLTWEGLTLRAQRDGQVVSRKIFLGVSAAQPPAPGITPVEAMASTVVVPAALDDYPWEFYTDQVPDRR